MSGDSTLVPRSEEASSGPLDQEKLNELLGNEPIEEEETEEEELEPLELKKAPDAPTKYFGRFDSLEAAEKSYKDIQTAYQKAKDELKAVRQENEKSQHERFESLDYDEQVKVLAKQIADLQGQIAETSSSSAEREVANYVESNAMLKESGFSEVFTELALSPKYRDYTLESVFQTVFKPRIEGVMSKKIRVKENKIKGFSEPDELSLDDVSGLSEDDYLKKRAKIFKAAGVKM